MSIPFRTAFIIAFLIYLATEVLISFNRPLIADRWVSESIKITENGKHHTADATFEMDLFSKGFLTDIRFAEVGYGVRYQFDGNDKAIGQYMGFPASSYTDNEHGIRLKEDGLCYIRTFRDRPGISGNIAIFTEDGCPNFESRHMMGDKLVFTAVKEGREMQAILKRDSRLNPLALFITKWNRHNYLGNAEEFMRNEPI